MFKSTLLTLALFAFSAPAMEREKQNLEGIYLPEGKTLEQVQQAPKEVAYSTYKVLGQRIFNSDALTYAMACAYHPLCTASLAVRYPFAWLASKVVGPVSLVKVLAEKEKLKPNTSGEGYVQFFRSCNEHSLATIAQTAAYLLKPTSVTDVVQDLQKKSIVQRLASNIGANIFAMLKARFKTSYKNPVFDTLASGQVVDYSKFGPDKTVPNLGAIQTIQALMPNPRFYIHYDKTFNANHDKITVLVCDNKAMLIAAAQAGWAGIHYDAMTMSVQELRARMEKLGLPVNK